MLTKKNEICLIHLTLVFNKHLDMRFFVCFFLSNFFFFNRLQSNFLWALCNWNASRSESLVSVMHITHFHIDWDQMLLFFFLLHCKILLNLSAFACMPWISFYYIILVQNVWPNFPQWCKFNQFIPVFPVKSCIVCIDIFCLRLFRTKSMQMLVVDGSKQRFNFVQWLCVYSFTFTFGQKMPAITWITDNPLSSAKRSMFFFFFCLPLLIKLNTPMQTVQFCPNTAKILLSKIHCTSNYFDRNNNTICVVFLNHKMLDIKQKRYIFHEYADFLILFDILCIFSIDSAVTLVLRLIWALIW